MFHAHLLIVNTRLFWFLHLLQWRLCAQVHQLKVTSIGQGQHEAFHRADSGNVHIDRRAPSLRFCRPHELRVLVH